jgi:hypothetical protein
LAYIKKEDKDVLTNMPETEEDFSSTLFKIAKEHGLEEAMEYFCEKKPHLSHTKYKSTKSNLKERLQDFRKSQLAIPLHDISTFDIPPEVEE